MRTVQLTKCFEPLQGLRARSGSRFTGLSPPVIFNITNRYKAVLLYLFSVFACFGVSVCTIFTFYVSRLYLVRFR